MPVFACGYDAAVFPYGFVLATQTIWLAKTKFVAAQGRGERRLEAVGIEPTSGCP